MPASAAQDLLAAARRDALQRQRLAYTLCTCLASLLGGLIWGAAGWIYGMNMSRPDPSPILFGLCCGAAAGLLGIPALWHQLRGPADEAAPHVRELLLDRGLLLLALEPVPAAALLAVFEVPGREAGPQGKLALPQSPRALNTQSFAQRLRLLLERYPQACRALGHAPWPRPAGRLQRVLAAARLLLPVLCVLVIFPGSAAFSPEVSTLLLAFALSLLVVRAAADELLAALLHGELVDVLAQELQPGAGEDSPPGVSTAQLALDGATAAAGAPERAAGG